MRHARLLPVILAACAEAAEAPTAASPALRLEVTPATASFVAGSSATVEINVLRLNGGTGTVYFRLDALPEGMWAIFTPANLPPGESRARLEITAPPGTPAGVYPLTIRAVGRATAVATFALDLRPAPDFRIEVLPTALEAPPGGEVTGQVRLLRTGGFGSPVALAVVDPPAGITAVAKADPLDASLLHLTIGVGPATAAGLHRLQLEGTAAGHPARIGRLDLRVHPPGTGGPVTWSFCSSPPAWAAFQDGYLGPWVPVASTGNAYTFPFARSVGAIAVAWEGRVQLFNGSVAELREQFPASCVPPRQVTVAIDMTGVTPADTVAVSWTHAPPAVSWATRPFWPRILTTVEEGTVDLVGVLTRGYFAGTGVPAGVIVHRDVRTPTGIPLVARWATDRVVPVGYQVSVPNGGPALLSVSSAFHTRNGARAPLGVQETSGGFPTTWWGLPESAREPGELHEVRVRETYILSHRSVTHFTGAAADLVLTLGPPPPSLAIGWLAAGAYRRPTVKGTLPLEYRDQLAFNWTGDAGDGPQYTLRLWRGYGLDTGDLDYTFPDLSGLAGWQTRWGLDPRNTFSSAQVEGWAGEHRPGRRPSGEGGTIRTAFWQWPEY